MGKGALERVAESPKMSMGSLRCRRRLRLHRHPIEDLPHPSYWNDDPCTPWLGPSNVGYAYIDGHRERVLIDSGARANAITPAYCRQHKLKVRPVNELATNPTSIPVSGIGGVHTGPRIRHH